MNIQRWKGIVWFTSLSVGGYLAYYFSDFLRHKTELWQEIKPEELAAVLDSVKKPAEQKTDVIEYSAIQRVFHDHDWTGKEKEKPKLPTQGEKPQAAPRVAVASLLKVLAIKVDMGKPDKSVAYVKFVDQKLQAHTDKEDTILRPEERLFAPYQDIRVEAITGKGVVFAFDDATREKETVSTSPY